MRNSVFQSPVLMEGYLKKHSSGVIKRWQKRFFAIKGHYLNYYENENMSDTQLKGTIDLQKMQACGLTQVRGEFQLIVDGTTTMFRADDAETAQKWIESIKQGNA
jgi:hypothetical protein